MVIYLDVVIIENFVIDLFLLISTMKIMKIDTVTKRILIGSTIGSVYTITFFISELKFLSTFPFQIMISYIIMCVVLNKSVTITKLKAVGIFVLLSVLLSGMCFLLSLMECNYFVSTAFKLGENTMKNIVISIIAIYLVSNKVITYLKDRTVISNFKFDVEFEKNNIKYFIRGFLDTGNELREPLTNLPCILVEDSILGDLQKEENDYFIIPYSAVGVKGNLKGIKVDRIRIRQEGERWKEIKAIICFCGERLSRENDFNALLSRGVL